MTKQTFTQLCAAQEFIDSLPAPVESNVFILDEENEALRHFITHMTKSLGQALKMESERAQADFSYNIQSIINRHVTDINDYINANIHNLIKDKE